MEFKNKLFEVKNQQKVDETDRAAAAFLPLQSEARCRTLAQFALR